MSWGGRQLGAYICKVACIAYQDFRLTPLAPLPLPVGPDAPSQQPHENSTVRAHAQQLERSMGSLHNSHDAAVNNTAWLPFDLFDTAMDWMGPVLCQVRGW